MTQTLYDANGRPTELRQAVGTADAATERTLAYSDNGVLTALIDANLNRTTYEYDGHDRLVKTRFPVTAIGANASSTTDYEQLTLDANGNVTARRLRDGQSIGYTIDALNRVTLKDLPGGELDVSYGYDLAGRMTSAVFPATNQGMGFSHDALGRVANTTTNMGGPSRTLAYAYRLDGARTAIVHPDGARFDYAYDVLGRMANASWWTAAVGTVPFLAIAYQNDGMRSNMNKASSWTLYGYDNARRLTWNPQDFAGGTVNDVTSTFAYNPAHQVTAEARDNDAFAWGGHFNENVSSTPDGLNRIANVGAKTVTHDARGNITSVGSDTYAYDSENRLIGGPGGTSLSYDPLGRLSAVTQGGNTTRFLYDGLQRVAEYDAAGNMLRRFAWGPGLDEPILQDEGNLLNCSGTFFPHADIRGSVIAWANCGGNRAGIRIRRVRHSRRDQHRPPRLHRADVGAGAGALVLQGAGLSARHRTVPADRPD